VARPRHVPEPEIELEEFFDLSIDPLSIIDFDGEFKRVNASFVRLLGYPKPELFSRTALDILHPDDVEPARGALAQLAEGDDLVGFEARVVCADGSVRWLEWNTRSMPERGVLYSVGRDTTERRRVEAELREAHGLLEASRDELRVLAEEQAALRRVATLVARGVPPADVFEAIAREAGRLLGVDAMHMGRYDTDGAISVAGWGRAGGHLPVGTRVELDGTNVASRVFQSGRQERVDGYSEADGTTAERLRHGMRVYSSVAVPIVVDGRLWGFDDRILEGGSAAAGRHRVEAPGLHRACRDGDLEHRGAHRTCFSTGANGTLSTGVDIRY
jgi:PAS domain S-box-containing protein